MALTITQLRVRSAAPAIFSISDSKSTGTRSAIGSDNSTLLIAKPSYCNTLYNNSRSMSIPVGLRARLATSSARASFGSPSQIMGRQRRSQGHLLDSQTSGSSNFGCAVRRGSVRSFVLPRPFLIGGPRLLQPVVPDERWLGKTGQRDKWILCLMAASMAANRSDHDETTPPQPHAGVQGESSAGCHQG